MTLKLAKVLRDLHEDIEDNRAGLMALSRANHISSKADTKIKTTTEEGKERVKDTQMNKNL